MQTPLGHAFVAALSTSKAARDIDIDEWPDGSARLRIPNAIMFASGRHDLSPAVQATLIEAVAHLQRYCGITVHVVGHTDSTGSLPTNMGLSQDRARAVVAYLQDLGYDRKRMTFEGRGPHEPVASNLDEDGRQRNRRVEIFARPPSS